MIILLIIAAVYIIGVFTEKSDYQRMKEANELPPFTQKQAEQYYNIHFKKPKQ